MAETVREFVGRENYLAKEYVLDISKKLWQFEPSANPFIVVSTKMGTETAHNTKVEWIEDNPIPERVQYTGATEASAGTTLTFTNWTYLRNGDVLFNPRTRERMLVTADVASASVTVGTRDLGTETGGAGLLNQGDMLEILSAAKQEGSSFDPDDPRMNIPTEQYNYVQLEMDWAQVTRTAANCQQAAGGSLFKHHCNKAMRNHRKKMEKTAFWGARANTSGTPHYQRSMGGIHSRIDTHTWNVNGELTPAGFDWHLEQILDDTPDNMRKTLFCPNFVGGRISNWGRNYVRYSPGRSKKYGFEVNEYIGGSGGGVDIVRCPIFRGSNWMKGIGFLLEMDKIFFKFLKGGKTTMETKCETKKDDYHLAKIRSEYSIILANEARHGFFYNVTG